MGKVILLESLRTATKWVLLLQKIDIFSNTVMHRNAQKRPFPDSGHENQHGAYACKKMKTTTCDDINTPRFTLIDLPVEVIVRVYDALSPKDTWTLFKTHPYFQYTQQACLKKFTLSPKLKGNVNGWLLRFMHLTHLTIKHSRNDLHSMDASLLSQRLIALTLPAIPHFIFRNPEQLPHSLIELHLPGSTLYFEHAHFLPPCLQSLTLHHLEIDANGNVPVLPPTLTYLYANRLEPRGGTGLDINNAYYGLPDTLLHLYAPLSTSVESVEALPRGLLTLCDLPTWNNTYPSDEWASNNIMAALPLQLEHVCINLRFRIFITDLALFSSSLRTLHITSGHFADDDALLDFDILSHFKQLTTLSINVHQVALKRIIFPPTLTALWVECDRGDKQQIMDKMDIAHIPANVVKLHLGSNYMMRSSTLKQLPLHLTHLELSSQITPLLNMANISHLEDLKHLHFISCFDYYSLQRLPRGLTSLELVAPGVDYFSTQRDYRLAYVTPDIWKALPPLKRLIFHGMSYPAVRAQSDPILIKHLPPSLTELDLDLLPIHPRAYRYLPPLLKSLKLYLAKQCDYTLLLSHLPSSLRSLKCYDQSLRASTIDVATLPPTLVEIQGINPKYPLDSTSMQSWPFDAMENMQLADTHSCSVLGAS